MIVFSFEQNMNENYYKNNTNKLVNERHDIVIASHKYVASIESTTINMILNSHIFLFFSIFVFVKLE